jgi:hypothetical protein
MSWLEYSKVVLEKVRFDRRLFRKELRKSLRWLSHLERLQLLSWCRKLLVNRSKNKKGPALLET